MLRILNFINDKKIDIFAKLKYCFSPKILKRVMINELEVDILIYDIFIPINLKKGNEKVIQKLIRELIKDESYEFICEKGKYYDLLMAYGFKISNLKEYLVKKVSTAVEVIIKTSQLSPDKVNIVLINNEFNNYTLKIIGELINLSKNISLISPCFEKYSNTINDIFDEFGSAIIITDSYEPIKRANIILIINCEELLFRYIKDENVLIICLDEKIKENNNIKIKIITSFCFSLPREIIEIIPSNIAKSEVASAIYQATCNEKRYERINEFYCFNKQISLKEIKDKFKMLDRV